MTTLTITQAGCPEGFTLGRQRDYTVTTYQEAAAAYNAARNVTCSDPECETKHWPAVGHKRDKAPAEPKPAHYEGDRMGSGPAAELWQRDSGKLQVLQIRGEPHEQRRILESRGFTRVTGSIKPTIKTAFSGIAGDALCPHLEAADTWIADNIKPDHAEHTCPDCAGIVAQCTDLACVTPVHPYACAPCRERAAAAARQELADRAHRYHACGECNAISYALAARYSGTCTCTGERNSPNECGHTAGLYAVAMLTDAPAIHCPDEGCRTLVPRAGQRCTYHEARAKTPTPQITSALCSAEDCNESGTMHAPIGPGWYCRPHYPGILSKPTPAPKPITDYGDADAWTPLAPPSTVHRTSECPVLGPISTMSHCDHCPECRKMRAGRPDPYGDHDTPTPAPVITSVTPTEDGGLAITFAEPVPVDALATAAVQEARRIVAAPATTATAPHTCTTRAHTPRAWEKRGFTLRPDAQSHERDGWTLYCRHQVTERSTA